MNHYLKLDNWASIVRDLKDSEKIFGHEAYHTERICREILNYIRYTRLRQFTLFSQKRGEEYERLLAKLQSYGFDSGSIMRIVENEQFWGMTLELGQE
jgi:hypothetical protein